MNEKRKCLTKTEAAKKVGRGCHKPQSPLTGVKYLEPFETMLSKLSRNCSYTISEKKIARFKKGSRANKK